MGARTALPLVTALDAPQQYTNSGCVLALVTIAYSGIGERIMRSSGPQWIALVLAVLALVTITYIATPPGVIKQATALWDGG
jgi:hypothetical protein